jgi:hypothetical protein
MALSITTIKSFSSALELRVSFGLLNNLPPFFSIHLSSPILSLSFYGAHHVHPPTISAPSLMSISVLSIHLKPIF